MKVVCRLVMASVVLFAMSEACASRDVTDGGAGSEAGSCFSPTRSPALAVSAPEAGCPCEGNGSQCVATTYQGRPWNAAMTCIEGHWRSVEEGPCPSLALPRADCVVEGNRYRDGEAIPDPYSCNSCFCEDGQVSSCTEIGCAEACPAGSARGMSCAACGPGDGCEAIETGCLTQCNTRADCQDPEHFACSDGLCRNLCP